MIDQSLPSLRAILNILRLGASGYDKDGWVRISPILWPLIHGLNHHGLLEFKTVGDAAFLRLSKNTRILFLSDDLNI